MSQEKPSAENQDAPENGNTDLIKVRHKGDRMWLGVSDTVVWRVVQSTLLVLLIGKSFAPAKATQDTAASAAIIMQVDSLTKAVTEGQDDIKQLQKAVQKLDVDTGKLSQALADLRRP